ncbi:MAG: FtsL-like putative cell division protein [Bacteroidia bacterium]|nr:FtsL-like putative cell division protein [Bacteroidia bacterium]MDW8303018.1 FtsL-like putative cell division protein [Bacteroidia bacterium]
MTNKPINKIIKNEIKLEPEIIDDKKVQYSSFDSYVKFIVFLMLIGILYIAYTNRAENTRRKIHKYQQELKELKWRYAESHAKLMKHTQQAHIAQKAETLGLKMLQAPPIQLIVQPKEK